MIGTALGLLLGLGVGFGRNVVSDLSSTDRTAGDSTSRAEPYDAACGDDEAPGAESSIRPRPALPVPVPNAPDQHARIAMPENDIGQLDLAPGGAFNGSPASDATTVYIVCGYEGPDIPTGIICDRVLETGQPWRPELHQTSVVMVVYEARSGQEVGRSEPIAWADDPTCLAARNDDTEPVVYRGYWDYLLVVDWARDHLTGATYTP